MKKDPITKLKVKVLHTVVDSLVFIEFLEHIPIKLISFYFRVSIYTVLFAFLLSLSVFEARNGYINQILNFYLVQNPYPQQTSIDIRPYIKEEIPLPKISAESYIVYDANSTQIILEKDAKKILPPASITKLMTALVALDYYDLDQKLVIPEYCTKFDTQRVGFLPGEVLSVDDLIQSLLINSAGDSACTLANINGSNETFVGLMNAKAFAIGMNSTNFTNSIGLDTFDGTHLASAQDLLLLSRESIKNSYIKNIVGKKDYIIKSGLFERYIPNTNILLSELPGSVGIKTGKTYAAGEVLSYQYNKDDVNLIIIVMKSDNRFADTKLLLEWTLASYSL